MTPASGRPTQSDIREFWNRVWEALQRVAAFFVFAGAHWLIRAVTVLSTPADWPEARLLVEATGWGIFMILYLYLGWDMLAVFMPRLRGKRDGVTAKPRPATGKK
jgi:hypothetical protein